MNIEKKRAHEIQILSEMIDLYARNHAINCDDLKQYAIKRTTCCPFHGTENILFGLQSSLL